MKASLTSRRDEVSIVLGSLSVLLPFVVFGLDQIGVNILTWFLLFVAVSVVLGAVAVVLGSKRLTRSVRVSEQRAQPMAALVGRALGALGSVGWLSVSVYLIVRASQLHMTPLGPL